MAAGYHIARSKLTDPRIQVCPWAVVADRQDVFLYIVTLRFVSDLCCLPVSCAVLCVRVCVYSPYFCRILCSISCSRSFLRWQYSKSHCPAPYAILNCAHIVQHLSPCAVLYTVTSTNHSYTLKQPHVWSLPPRQGGMHVRTGRLVQRCLSSTLQQPHMVQVLPCAAQRSPVRPAPSSSPPSRPALLTLCPTCGGSAGRLPPGAALSPSTLQQRQMF